MFHSRCWIPVGANANDANQPNLNILVVFITLSCKWRMLVTLQFLRGYQQKTRYCTCQCKQQLLTQNLKLKLARVFYFCLASSSIAFWKCKSGYLISCSVLDKHTIHLSHKYYCKPIDSNNQERWYVKSNENLVWLMIGICRYLELCYTTSILNYKYKLSLFCTYYIQTRWMWCRINPYYALNIDWIDDIKLASVYFLR